MAISQQDVARIARLARIELSPDESIARLARIELSPDETSRAQTDLDGMLGLIETLQAIDTTGVEPMAHPLAAHQNIALRLRADAADCSGTVAQREALMANSPAEEEGLFLVPTVIE